MLRQASRTLTRTMASLSPARAIVAYNSKDGRTPNWKVENINVKTSLAPNELLIETKAVGICHTDLAFGTTLPSPKVLGHEGCGIVKAVGSEVGVAKEGDKVFMSYAHCGHCGNCKKHDPAFCEDFNGVNMDDSGQTTVFEAQDGSEIRGRFFGQSSYSSLTVANDTCIVNASPFNLSDDEFHMLAPLGCGIQTGAGTASILANVKRGEAVAIYGLGGVGFSALMAAKVHGAGTIIAVDIADTKLEMAKELGATHVIKAGDDEAVHNKIMDITGRGTDVGIECIGGSRFIQNAMKASAVRGRVLFLGVPRDPADELRIPVLEFMFKGGQLSTATEGGAVPQEFIPKMIQWYKDGKFPVDKLITTYKFDEFEKALDDMHKGTVVKPVLIF